jgi:NADH-quinone oxidoreductase subunit A
MSPQTLITFFIAGAFLVGIAIVIGYLMSPKSSNAAKAESYECCIPTKGITWLQFNVGYYLFAILFLVFDVESVFVFPWAVVMKDFGMVGFIEIVIFFIILIIGLLYAWKKHALIWQ